MLGNEASYDSVAGLGVVDANITVLLNSQVDSSHPQGVLFTLRGSDGTIAQSSTSFWAYNKESKYLRALDLTVSHQGILVFVKSGGPISSDRKMSLYSAGSPAHEFYGTLYFDLTNQLGACHVYPSSLNSYTVTMRNAFSESKLPNLVLLAGDDSWAVAYTSEVNFAATASTNNCALTFNSICVQCKSAYCLNLPKDNTCVSGCSSKPYREQVDTRSYVDQDKTFSISCISGTGGNVGCLCNNDLKYTRGTCSAKCSDGTKIDSGNNCLKRCPDGAIMTSDETTTGQAFKDNHMDFLVRFYEYQGGLKVSVPHWIPRKADSNEAKVFPKVWTMTMWVRLREPTGVHYLVNAFNHIKLKREQQKGGEKKSYISLDIGGTTLAPTSTVLSGSTVLTDDTWNYVGVSKGIEINSEGTEVMIVNMIVQPFSPDAAPLIFQVPASNNYVNVVPTALEPYLILGGTVGSDGTTLATTESLAGYLMEYKFLARFMTTNVLAAHKLHAYPVDSFDILSYWRLTGTAKNTEQTDLHNTSLKIISSTPTLIERNTKEPAEDKPTDEPVVDLIKLALWDGSYNCQKFPRDSTTDKPVIGEAVELFPPIVSNSTIYSEVTKINVAKKDDALSAINTNDTIYATEGDCYLGYNQAKALRTFKVEGEAISTVDDNNKQFKNLVAGKSYRLCFKSAKHLTTHFLQWIYVARVPEYSLPKAVIVYKQWGTALGTELTFQTYGGDDSIDSIVYIAKSDADIKNSCPKETCTSLAPKAYAAKEGTFSYEGTFTGSDTGRHSIYWRPFYSANYEVYSKIPNASVKIQGGGQVRFGNFFINAIETNLYYQGELYTLKFEVEDLKEGDEVGFYPNNGKIPNNIFGESKSLSELETFSFSRGVFPQIYLSKESLFPSKSSENLVGIEVYFRPKEHSDEGTFWGAGYYAVSSSSDIALISDFDPPLKNPYMMNKGQVSFRITHESKACYTLYTKTLTIKETFPLDRQISDKLNSTIVGEDSVFTIAWNDFKIGHQYEIQFANDALVNCGDLKRNYSLLSHGSYKQVVRALDFAIDSVHVNRTGDGSSRVEIYGRNFGVYNPYILIDKYSIEYRTYLLEGKLYMRSGTTLKELSGKITSWTNDKIVFEKINFGNLAGELYLELDVHRECVCTTSESCTCDNLSSVNKANDPAFFYGGGRLENFVIAMITCTSSCYSTEEIPGGSCVEVASTYPNKNKNGLECVYKCNDVVRITNNENSITSDNPLLECVNNCLDDEFVSNLITSKMCMPCDSSCATCAGPGADACTGCKEGLIEFRKSCSPTNEGCDLCMDNYPKFSNSAGKLVYQGVCIKETDKTGVCNLKNLIKVEVRGYTGEYENRRDPIQLILSTDDVNVTFENIIWSHATTGTPDATLFTSGTEKTAVANITYRYVFKSDISVPLMVSVSADVRRKNDTEYYKYYDVIAINHTFNVKTINFSFEPPEGNVHGGIFSAKLVNLTLLSGTEIKLISDCDNDKSGKIEKIGATSYDEDFVIPSIKFFDWSNSYQRERRDFTILAELKKGIETVICNTTIYLDNTLPNSKKEEIINGFDPENEIKPEELAKISMVLAEYYIAMNDKDSCITDSNCDKDELCQEVYSEKKCIADDPYDEKIKNIANSVTDYIEQTVDSVQKNLKKNVYTSEELKEVTGSVTGLIINMATLSEIAGADLTGTIDSLLNNNTSAALFGSATESNIEDIEKMVQAASSIIDIKLKHYVETNNDTLNMELQANFSEKILSMTGFVDSALACATNALPPGNTLEFNNDFIKVAVSNDNAEPSGPKTYALSNDGPVVVVPFLVLHKAQTGGSIRTRFIEWKSNPYENFTSYGKYINSTVVGFSFIDETNAEIKISVSTPIKLKLPLLTAERQKIEFKCSYFDPTVTKYVENSSFTELGKNRTVGEFLTTGCGLVGIDEEYATCECNHLTDFAVIGIYHEASEPIIVIPDEPSDPYTKVQLPINIIVA